MGYPFDKLEFVLFCELNFHCIWEKSNSEIYFIKDLLLLWSQ